MWDIRNREAIVGVGVEARVIAAEKKKVNMLSLQKVLRLQVL
jgi:hypothetical protein